MNAPGIALTKCFFCGESSDILMQTRWLAGENGSKFEDKFHNKVVSKEPCNKCKEHMKLGIIIIGIDEDKTPEDAKEEDYYRSGRYFVIKEEAFQRFPMDDKMKEEIFEKRICFMSTNVLEAVGFPMNGEQ